MAKRLSAEILKTLVERTGKTESTIRSQISRRKQKNPILTSNAAAHLLALDNNTSVLQKLDEEDRESLKGISEQSTRVVTKTQNPARATSKIKSKPLIDYKTENYFIKEHMNELSRAYRARCFTSVFILFRKIIENLLIDILRKKYPKQPELFFDVSRSRNHDFSVVLDNIYKQRNDFDPEGKKAIGRLNQLIKPFKKDANDKTHSWFHIVKSESEVDIPLLEQAVELIKIVEAKVGIR